MATFKEKSAEQRQRIVEEVITFIESGGLDWEKCWKPSVMTPYNPLTKTRYKGVNRFYLGLVASALGYDDPRWLTFSQIKKAGYRLAKGAKGAHVER